MTAPAGAASSPRGGGSTSQCSSPSLHQHHTQDYVVYQPHEGRFGLDLTGVEGSFDLTWWELLEGSASGGTVEGGRPIQLVSPDRRPAVAHLCRARPEPAVAGHRL